MGCKTDRGRGKIPAPYIYFASRIGMRLLAAGASPCRIWKAYETGISE